MTVLFSCFSIRMVFVHLDTFFVEVIKSINCILFGYFGFSQLRFWVYSLSWSKNLFLIFAQLKAIKVRERRKMIWIFIFYRRFLFNKNILIASLKGFGLIFEMENLEWLFLHLLIEFWAFEIEFSIWRFFLIQLINDRIEVLLEFKLFLKHKSVFVFLLL